MISLLAGGVFFSSAVLAQDVQVAPSESLSSYIMGTIYEQYGQTEEAVLEFEKAKELDDNNHNIYFKLGSNYARLGRLKEAIEALKYVIKLRPTELQAHYLLALVYSTQKDYTKAASEYEIILKSLASDEPDNIEIYGYLGQLYYSQGKYQEAIEQFEKILSLEPKNANVMYLLGSLYLEVDKRTEALNLFLKAVDIDPEHDGCLNTLAYLYAEEGINLDDALSFINRALAIDPDNGAYLDSLGWIYYKKGEYPEALKHLQKADSILHDPVIYEHMGDVYFALQEPDQAKKNWDRSLELLPDQENVLKKITQLQEKVSVQRSKSQ